MDWGFVGATFARLIGALPLTLEVWALSVILGAVVAAGVTWMRVSGSKPLEVVARAYVALFRGTPLLIQLFIVHYGLASLPLVRPAFSGRSCATPSRTHSSRRVKMALFSGRGALGFTSRRWARRSGRSRRR